MDCLFASVVSWPAGLLGRIIFLIDLIMESG